MRASGRASVVRPAAIKTARKTFTREPFPKLNELVQSGLGEVATIEGSLEPPKEAKGATPIVRRRS